MSSLVTFPDEDVNALDTETIDPDIPVVVNSPPVPVTDSGVLVIESDVSIVPESVVIETEKDVIPPLPSTLSIVIVVSISPYCNCIVSFTVYPLPVLTKLIFESVIPDTLILVTVAVPVRSPYEKESVSPLTNPDPPLMETSLVVMDVLIVSTRHVIPVIAP